VCCVLYVCMSCAYACFFAVLCAVRPRMMWDRCLRMYGGYIDNAAHCANCSKPRQRGQRNMEWFAQLHTPLFIGVCEYE
jgi:hypothetical protein